MTDCDQSVIEMAEEDNQSLVGGYTFKLELKVDTPKVLYEAAKATKDGANANHLRHGNGKPNVEACLTTLLDPSSLPGCSVTGSAASKTDGEPGEYDAEIYVNVSSPKELLEAAKNHPDVKEGLFSEADLCHYGVVDVNECLRIILDPGYIAGCSVHGGYVTADSDVLVFC